MRMRVRILLLLALFVVPTTAFGMSTEEREATFWKVAVVDFAGRTPAVDGPTAGVRFAASLRDSKRFHVIDPRTVRRAVRDTGVDVSQGRLSEGDAKKLARKLDVDGVYIGRIEKGDNGFGALTIALHSGYDGRLFAQYRFTITPQFPLAEAQRVAAGYIQRLPYDGLVVSVRRDLALVNVGTANGIGTGSKVYSFEFTDVQRDSNGTVNGGNRKALAELEVVRAEQHGAWVRPLKGDMPEELAKISLRPVAGSADLKPTTQDNSTAIPYVDLDTAADVGLLYKAYQLTGTNQKYTSNTTLFPAPGIHVLWFPSRVFGTTLYFRHGFIPFRRPINGGTQFQTYAGSIDQVDLEAQIRHVFAHGRLAGGSLSIGGGLYYTGFKIQNQNPLVLTNDTYIGPVVSTDLRAPVLDRLAFHGNLGVVPYAMVKQSPVDNGTGAALGIRGTLGLDYHINDRLYLALDYGADSMQTTFPSGGGSRGIQNPKSSDLYHGLTFSMGWRSYR